MFSIEAVLAYIPTSSVWRFLFCCILDNILLLVFLMVATLTGVRWNLNVVFDLHFLYAQIWLAFFHVFFFFFLVFWSFGFLPLKKFCSIQLLTSLLVHWFWDSLVFWAPCIFWFSGLWCIANKDYFYLFCGQSLQFRNHLFCCAAAF
jgi:hypothetical protein